MYFIFLFNFHFEVKEQEIQIQKINLQNFLFLELFPSNFYSFFVVLVGDLFLQYTLVVTLLE
ncbi:hypothetical protein D7X25_30790 [bacterium 1XD42-8]|nr:hypothetical protein D7X25_30790 [bacterium 1XD42-8]